MSCTERSGVSYPKYPPERLDHYPETQERYSHRGLHIGRKCGILTSLTACLLETNGVYFASAWAVLQVSGELLKSVEWPRLMGIHISSLPANH